MVVSFLNARVTSYNVFTNQDFFTLKQDEWEGETTAEFIFHP